MKTKLSYSIYSFNELDNDLLYEVMKLRVDIFVVEQNCPYEELDNKDQHAIHVIGRDSENSIVAYARILKANEKRPPAVGRVIVHEKMRGSGVGHEIMEECLRYLEEQYGTRKSYLSSQAHLQKFYAMHGYKAVSEEYDWDGIPHVDMVLDPNGSS